MYNSLHAWSASFEYGSDLTASAIAERIYIELFDKRFLRSLLLLSVHSGLLLSDQRHVLSIYGFLFMHLQVGYQYRVRGS